MERPGAAIQAQEAGILAILLALLPKTRLVTGWETYFIQLGFNPADQVGCRSLSDLLLMTDSRVHSNKCLYEVLSKYQLKEMDPAVFLLRDQLV